MLTLRRTWPRPWSNDWSVLDDGEIVGRIYDEEAAHPLESSWYWTLNEATSVAHQTGITASGRAATFDDAKGAIRAAYEQWLKWAAEHARPQPL